MGMRPLELLRPEPCKGVVQLQGERWFKRQNLQTLESLTVIIYIMYLNPYRARSRTQFESSARQSAKECARKANLIMRVQLLLSIGTQKKD